MYLAKDLRAYSDAPCSKTREECTLNSSPDRTSRSSSLPLGISLSISVSKHAVHIDATLIHGLPLLAVGNPAHMYDETKILTLRVHDECMSPSSSALVYAKASLARQWLRRLRLRHLHLQTLPHLRHRGVHSWCSERYCGEINCVALTILIMSQGGVGVVVYFRKEGRALGEVTKFVFLPFLTHPRQMVKH